MRNDFRRDALYAAAIAAILLLFAGAVGSGDEAADSYVSAASADTPVYRIDTGRFIRREYLEEALIGFQEGRWGKFIGKDLPEGCVRCLTLPHHMPAVGLTIHALTQLAVREDRPGTVILLGPNHANAGPAAAVTSAYWQTPYGIVEPEADAIEALAGNGLATEAADVFEQEHSMGLVIPWLARFLPDVKIVPLIFHYQYPMDELDRLLDALGPWFGEGALLVVSADFSHHQTRDEAAKHDRETAGYLAAGDWQSISRLSSDYVDCPTLVAAMMRFAGERGLEGPAILANTNTGYITGAADQEVTSYYVIAYMN